MAARPQRCESAERGRLPKRCIAAAEYQLLRLDKELDLANSTAPELDIMPRNSNAVMSAAAVNLPLDGMYVLNRGVIEVPAPDERLHAFQQQGARFAVAGALARLDPCRAFPVLPHRLVIGFGRRRGDRDLRRTGIRPQPQIDAENVTFRCDFSEKLYDSFHHLDRRELFVAVACERKSLRIKKHYEVYVAGVIELERAHFPHGQDHEPAGIFADLTVDSGETHLRANLETKCRLHAGIGKARQLLHTLLEREHAADI